MARLPDRETLTVEEATRLLARNLPADALPADEAKAWLKAEAPRLVEDRYFVDEAARAIAKQRGQSEEWARRLQSNMLEAGERRALAMRDPDTWIRIAEGQRVSLACIVTRADVNAWLESSAAGYRWEGDEPADAPAVDMPPSGRTKRDKLTSVGQIAKEAASRAHPPAPGENDLREDIRAAMRERAEKQFRALLAAHLRTGKLRAVDPLSRAPFDPAVPEFDAADPGWCLNEAECAHAFELLGQRDGAEAADRAKAEPQAEAPAAKTTDLAPQGDADDATHEARPSMRAVCPDDPPPLKTGDIAEAFDGIDDLSAAKWRRKLGDVKNHAWVLPARAVKGEAPTPSTWWPLKLADLLQQEREVSFDTLNRKFVNQKKLKPWLPAWQAARRERDDFGR